MRPLLDKIGTRWVLIALVVAAVAFVAGVTYGLRTAGGIGAQEPTPPDVTFPPPTDEEWAAMLASKSEMREFTIYPVVATPSSNSVSKAAAEAKAAQPGSGFYLRAIDKFIRLPDDVEITGWIPSIMCLPTEILPRCPTTPIYELAKGESEAWVDALGYVFVEKEDRAAFIFLDDKYGLEFVVSDTD